MEPQSRSSRRAFLGKTATLCATGTAVTLAGCSTGVEREPDPQVVLADPQTDLAETRGGDEIAVDVLVHNAGDAGSVTIYVETHSHDHQVIDQESKTVEMDGQSQTEFTITMTVSASAAWVDARAEAADQ